MPFISADPCRARESAPGGGMTMRSIVVQDCVANSGSANREPGSCAEMGSTNQLGFEFLFPCSVLQVCGS